MTSRAFRGGHRAPRAAVAARWLLLLLMMSGAAAQAATITYVFSGQITATFGGSGSSYVASIGAVGDPSKVVAGATRCNDVADVTVIISGQTAIQVHTPMSIVVDNGSAYSGLRTGTCAAAGADWFRVNASQFGSYDLATSIGPFTGVATYANSALNISTSAGTMILYDQSLTQFDAFVATSPAGATAVPTLGEGALAVLLAAVAAIGAVPLRRRTKAAN